MKEYNLQCRVMTAKGVKVTDRFIMLCILKSVDWNTWTKDVAMSAIYNKYEIPRATFSRSIKQLKELGWISVVSNRTGLKQHHTTITVHPNIIKQHESTVTQNDTLVTQNDTPVTQNDTLVTQIDTPKVNQNDTPVTQNDTPVTQIDTTVTQNDAYINLDNLNNINQSQDNSVYVTRDEAKKYTSQFHPRDLRHLADDRDKVPLHILSAKNRRLEIERRQAVIEEEQGRPMRHHERLNFISKQNDEDSKKYPPRSFERNNIRKVW
jgi:hypothetical protein